MNYRIVQPIFLNLDLILLVTLYLVYMFWKLVDRRNLQD